MTKSIIDPVFIAIISLLPVLIVFIYYYKNFIFKRSKIISLSAFFWGILSCNATILLQSFLPETNNAIIKSFLYAGFIEEIVRYLFIIFLINKSSAHFTIIEGVFNAILIGLGFAISENLHYSFNFTGNIIFLRTISSVPIHVLLSGIMGYFASYASLNSSRHISKNIPFYIRRRNIFIHLMAIVYPVLIHGFYDWSLLTRSKLVYLVPVIIIYIFIHLEYLIDIGKTIFGKNILKMLKITADDVRIILRQQHYEDWVNSRQNRIKMEGFIIKAWKIIPTLVSISFICLAFLNFYFIFYKPELIAIFQDLNHESKIALLGLYPLTVGIIILIIIKINFSFFRIFISHVPQTALVNVHPPDDEEESYSFVMDIHPIGVFLHVDNHWPRDSNLILEFIKIDKKGNESLIPIEATIMWNNQFNKSFPLGYVCHFKKTSLRFVWFRITYHFRKFLKIPATYKTLHE